MDWIMLNKSVLLKMKGQKYVADNKNATQADI